MAESKTSEYYVQADVPVAELKCKDAFEGLSTKERMYAYYLARASWEGSKICLIQTSAESPGIFLLLQAVLSDSNLKEASLKNGVSEDTFHLFMVFAASFLANFGNYRSFGDDKFIPELSKADFETIVKSSAMYAKDEAYMTNLWNGVADLLYDVSERKRQLGLENGITTYYSSNVTAEEADRVNRFMEAKGISAYNTRVFKTADATFELRLAAADGEAKLPYTGEHTFEGATIRVLSGDYAPFMARVVENLKKAVQYAANDTQVQMLNKYIESFTTGDNKAHQDGSVYWVQDKGPVVENYIGFIESYRDPLGVRGEWEGFVAVVNKEVSKKFGELVSCAEQLLEHLPWTKEYEKDTFLRPDFTSLDVVAFGSSGVPAGINIPNYDDIRQDIGFKNVSLGNVLSARNFKERVTFLKDADQQNFKDYVTKAFEVQVGLHELLGHGSGKLFAVNPEGKKNFADGTKNLVSGEEVTSWYKPGETYDSKFGAMSSTYEECRAECVGIYLCVNKDVLKVFGFEGEEASTITYINWLNMARAGLLALQYYSPAAKKWGQAHMQARFAILRVMLEAGQDFVKIHGFDEATGPTTTEEGESGVTVTLDASKIDSVGVPAVGEFLKKLQVYKAMADVTTAKAMYDKYTAVSPAWEKLRAVVVDNRRPRPVLVQPELQLQGDSEVALKTFEASLQGIVESFQARFPVKDDELFKTWEYGNTVHKYD